MYWKENKNIAWYGRYDANKILKILLRSEMIHMMLVQNGDKDCEKKY